MLEETIDENYEPTQEEIDEYAKWLGMDPQEDKHLFWVAREGLKAPLPSEWKPCQSPDGELYYFNFSNGESVWDHPCDEYYRARYKVRLWIPGRGPAQPPSALTTPLQCSEHASTCRRRRKKIRDLRPRKTRNRRTPRSVRSQLVRFLQVVARGRSKQWSHRATGRTSVQPLTC